MDISSATMTNIDCSSVSVVTFARNQEDKKIDNLYNVEERLPCVFSLFNALQILISQFINLIWLPMQLSHAICLLPADPVRVYMVSTAFIVSGVVTSLQSVLGIRLPTMTAPSVIYTSSFLSLLQESDLECPSDGDLYAMGPGLRTLEWQKRLREVQGALLFAGISQAVVGFSGLQSWLFKSLSPVAVAPAIILAGITMISEPLTHLKDNWSLFLIITVLVVLFALIFRDVTLPLPTFSIRSGLKAKYYPAFRMFPVLWTCAAVCVICKLTSYIHQATPYPDKEVVGFQEAVDNAKWFFIPFPFEWGLPTLSLATVIHMLPTIVIQSVISLFFFYGNANVCGVGMPSRPAVSRGLALEGLGLMFGSMWGHSVTTSLPNIGLTPFTTIASRSSTQLAALMMICLSHFSHAISVLANIPIQFLSALHLCFHAGLVYVGISILKFINFRSPRDGFIVGFSIFLGFVVPQWMSTPGVTIDTGLQIIDVFLFQSLKSSVFVGFVTGCILDICLSGQISSNTPHAWKLQSEEDRKTYQLPTWEELLCSILERSPFFSSD